MAEEEKAGSSGTDGVHVQLEWSVFPPVLETLMEVPDHIIQGRKGNTGSAGTEMWLGRLVVRGAFSCACSVTVRPKLTHQTKTWVWVNDER